MIQANCCCNPQVFAIVIYNFNSQKDDNFKVVLNGNEIGHIDNNSDTITGRIFSDATEFTPTAILVPNPNNFEPTLPVGTLILGTNTLRIESIQNNGNSNLDVAQVGYWHKDETGQYAFVTQKINDTFIFASGVGNGVNYTFSFP
jgi:hypothetical protein